MQYHTLQTVKHCFEQEKLQLQEIPWKEVPIPPPQVNVKILGEKLNKQKKARKKMMKWNTQCKDENCNDENCEAESSEEPEIPVKVEESAKPVTKSEIKNKCTHCSKDSEFMICNECTKDGRGIKLNIDKNKLLGDVYIGAGAPEKEPVLTEFAKAAIALKSKLHAEAEKPINHTRKEIARCDNLYIKNCLQAVQKLRDEWIGDDNQEQETAPAVKNNNCCCFSCLKIARK